MRKLIPFFIFIILLASCKMNVKTNQLPPDIKSLSVDKIINNTSTYGIVSVLKDELNNAFIADGRLILVDASTADALLNVNLTNYSLEPISYDINGTVKEYKMRITADITFYNNREKKILFEQKGIEESQIYIPPNSPLVLEQNLIPQTEDEVKRAVLSIIAEDIVKRVIDGWW